MVMSVLENRVTHLSRTVFGNIFVTLIFLICLITFLLSPQLLTAYPTSLSDYRAWYATIPEAPSINDMNDPSFLAYFKAREPGFLTRLAMRVGIIEKPWDIHRLAVPLKRLTAKLTAAPKRVLSVKQGDRVVVFGNLHGSIFSFMRDLTELERSGIIDDQLRLAPGYYLVFLGDLINYSPHTFELLDLVLTLMEKNGDRVFYVASEQEKDGFWENFVAMLEQLKLWQKTWGNLIIKDLNNFFAVLPDALVIDHLSDKTQVIICSGQDPDWDKLKKLPIAAAIMGERWMQTNWVTDGLDFFGFTRGAALWSLISCPNRFYQDIMKFHRDSFIILTIGQTVNQTILAFFNRDMTGRAPFVREDYSLTLGFPVKPGSAILSQPIMPIGSTVTLSGAVGSVGRGIKQGIESGCMKINSEGGMQGVLLRPVVLDDTYIPRLARRNVDYFMKTYHSDIFVGQQGTPTLAIYFDWIRDGKLYAFFPSTGGEQFRLPDVSHIIHYRKTYPQETRKLVDHICARYGATQFAIVYQDDAFGQQLAQAAHEELLKKGIKVWTDIPFKPNELLLNQQVKKLLNSGADAIGFFFTSTTLAEAFLNRVGGGFLIGKHLFAISFLDDSLFRAYLTSHGLKFTFSYAVPNPFKNDLEIVREFREEMAREHRDVDSNSLEGYIAVALFAEGARQAQLPLTGGKIMHWFEGLKNYQFKGLTLTFNPQTRSFELPTWIRTETDQWISV